MTLVCGLVGHPIAHSRSPALHNKWFQDFGIDARYELFEKRSEDELKRFLGQFLLQPQSLGLNITIPYKKIMMNLGVTCDEIATEVDAVNTLYRVRAASGNEWRLGNTDVVGFQRSVEHMKVPIHDTTIVVLGAGGSAKAALVGARRLGIPAFKIFCRDNAKAARELSSRLFSELKIETFEKLQLVSVSTSNVLIVNTVPLGHRSEANPYASSAFDFLVPKSNRVFFLDLIYNDTPAVLEARSLGLTTLNGETMLVEQARASFQMWTGKIPS